MRLHSSALHYFDVVRRCRSIREAARQLNVASSAVNRQILRLEEEIGMPLFERLPGGLKLTAAGEVLSRHVIEVLQDAERTRSELEALKGVRIGHVEIAAVEGLATDFLPTVIEKLNKQYPNITIGITSMGSGAIAEAVAEGEADIGIAFDLPHDRALRQVAVGRFVLGAVMPRNHPLKKHKTVSFSECSAYPALLAKPDLSIYRALEPLMARSAPVRKTVVSNSIALTKRLAELGVGIAFQTRFGIEGELRDKRFLHIPLVHAKRFVLSDLGIYARAGRSLPVAADVLLRLLAEELAARAEADPAYKR
ncbi:LysR family transcriptional regulator [Parvibaculum sedimenti]|uniref:LysR family transcriptional regulator n=1 Tax=Parvibaculum sedimenti TaxID=2608632 RepID=A0A6N6VFB2_9HYPH|nr:LysR family transcriptional regulator [Parvibaculum sedimenti]KAB7739479.1 LysR family transcriptional regulator [Parvibaculum sedimenti]